MRFLNVVHHHGAVGETVQHNKGPKESPVGSESCFLFITIFNVDVLASPSDIKLGEKLGFPEFFHKLCKGNTSSDQFLQVLVSSCKFRSISRTPLYISFWTHYILLLFMFLQYLVQLQVLSFLGKTCSYEQILCQPIQCQHIRCNPGKVVLKLWECSL